MRARAVLLLVAAVGCVDKGREAFEARLAKLREAGEPVEAADLVEPPVPDEENLAVALDEIVAWFVAVNPRGGIAPMYLLWNPAGDPPDSDEERAEGDAFLASVPELCTRLEAALRRPRVRLDIDWSKGYRAEIRQIGHLQLISQALRVYALHASDGSSLTARVVRMARISDALGKPVTIPGVIGALVQQTVRCASVRDVHELRGRRDLDVATARRELDPLWAAAERSCVVPPDSVRLERVTAVQALREWVERGSPPEEWFDEKRRRKIGPWAPPFKDGLRLLDRFDAAIRLCGGSPDECWTKSKILERARDDDGYLLTSLTTPLFPKVFARSAESCARLRLARLALALMEHRAEKGAWPASLADLGPRFPDGAVPRNPLTSAEFAYERDGKAVRLLAPNPPWSGLETAEQRKRLEEDELLWSWEE